MTTDSESKGPACSAWRIWLHPIRTRDEMASLSEEIATLRDLLARTERDRERLMQETRENTDSRKKLVSRHEEEREKLKAAISRLESERGELKKELGEWRQTRMELDAIAEQMKEWEAVKDRYEERIKMLTLRLRDALGHKNPGRRADRESDILEEGENPFLVAEEERSNVEFRTKDSDIANQILSDFNSSTISSSKSRGLDRDSVSGARRLPKDDSDWLISLPPE